MEGRDQLEAHNNHQNDQNAPQEDAANQDPQIAPADVQEQPQENVAEYERYLAQGNFVGRRETQEQLNLIQKMDSADPLLHWEAEEQATNQTRSLLVSPQYRPPQPALVLRTQRPVSPNKEQISLPETTPRTGIKRPLPPDVLQDTESERDYSGVFKAPFSPGPRRTPRSVRDPLAGIDRSSRPAALQDSVRESATLPGIPQMAPPDPDQESSNASAPSTGIPQMAPPDPDQESSNASAPSTGNPQMPPSDPDQDSSNALLPFNSIASGSRHQTGRICKICRRIFGIVPNVGNSESERLECPQCGRSGPGEMQLLGDHYICSFCKLGLISVPVILSATPTLFSGDICPACQGKDHLNCGVRQFRKPC